MTTEEAERLRRAVSQDPPDSRALAEITQGQAARGRIDPILTGAATALIAGGERELREAAEDIQSAVTWVPFSVSEGARIRKTFRV